MAKRLFFSFHYQDVIDFRANVPRNSWLLQKREDAGFFDNSLWESTKKTGEESLKRLINSGLDNTSVTAVLIGTQTHSRRWVRYEIVKSMYKSNHIIGIHINSIPDKYKLTKPLGANPFEYLAIWYSADGKSVTVKEASNGQWVDYKDFPGWTLANRASSNKWGKLFNFSHFYSVYDWVAGDGYKNLVTWVDG